MASTTRVLSCNVPPVPLAHMAPSLHLFSFSQRRCLHTRKLHCTRPAPAATADYLHNQQEHEHNVNIEPWQSPEKLSSPLSSLPLGTLLRSIMIQQATSVPALLRPSVTLLSFFAETRSSILSPDRNPIVKVLLRSLLYNHFCAGENAAEVNATTIGLKKWGVRGIVLGWAREFEFRQSRGHGASSSVENHVSQTEARAQAEQAIQQWAAGSINTVQLAIPGDVVALKFSGAGPLVLSALQSNNQTHPPAFIESLHKICRLAKSKGVSLAIDAEQQRIQAGINALALSLSQKYNGSTPGSAVIKNTYQVYLKATASNLSRDLKLAAREGWCLGAKLVRGAYLASEQRDVIWDTKEATDRAYDGIAEGLLRRSWSAGEYLSGKGAFPNVDLVLATHNMESVQRAIRIRQSQAERGEPRIKLVYAQLMGMADHVSAAAIQAGQQAMAQHGAIVEHSRHLKQFTGINGVEIPIVYKYIVWGNVGECIRYLVRRAEENRDAATRTKESREALWQELRRRVVG